MCWSHEGEGLSIAMFQRYRNYLRKMSLKDESKDLAITSYQKAV